MELEPAARRYLLGEPAVTGYVRDRVFTFRLHEHVDQTGARAVVLRRDGGWGAAQSNTPEYPLLRVMCWADNSRAGDEAARDDAIPGAYAVYRAVDAALLRRRRDVWWGSYGSRRGLWVITIQRWTEPTHRTKDDGPSYEGMPLGQTAVVSATYALQVVH